MHKYYSISTFLIVGYLTSFLYSVKGSNNFGRNQKADYTALKITAKTKKSNGEYESLDSLFLFITNDLSGDTVISEVVYPEVVKKLPPANYVVHAQHKGFEPYEKKVKLKEGLITWLNIIMKR